MGGRQREIAMYAGLPMFFNISRETFKHILGRPGYKAKREIHRERKRERERERERQTESLHTKRFLSIAFVHVIATTTKSFHQ